MYHNTCCCSGLIFCFWIHYNINSSKRQFFYKKTTGKQSRKEGKMEELGILLPASGEEVVASQCQECCECTDCDCDDCTDPDDC